MSRESVSHDSDLVCDLKSVVLLVENNISLLFSVWSDKSVHFSNLDAVQVLASLLDDMFVCALVYDENESVVIFDVFDSGITVEWLSDDRVLVPSGVFLDTSSHSECLSLGSQSLWQLESNLSPDLLLLLSMSALLHGSCDFPCLHIFLALCLCLCLS